MTEWLITHISITPKYFFMLHCHSAILPPAPTPHPQQPLICFLSLQISLHFQQFYINGNIQTTSVLIWLLLLGIIFLNYIHIVAGISCLFPSSIPLYVYITICLSSHLLMNFWVTSSLGLLQIKQLWTFIYKTSYVHILSFLLGKNLRIERLDNMLGVYLKHHLMYQQHATSFF